MFKLLICEKVLATEMDMQKSVKISENVIRFDSEYWHYYYRFSNDKPVITGKYLFFSVDKKELEKIVVDELEKGGFQHGKINTDKHKKGEEYVLCLYYKDDSKKFELADKYRNNSKVKYRYWKSDTDTFKGKYSKQFLERLPPEERKKWTEKKI